MPEELICEVCNDNFRGCDDRDIESVAYCYDCREMIHASCTDGHITQKHNVKFGYWQDKTFHAVGWESEHPRS